MKSHCWCLLGAISFALCISAGCVVVPPHAATTRPSVDDVVKRIKCDIYEAVIQKTRQRSESGKYPFAFLQGWAAKIHLTLIVDDTGNLNPGATFIHVLPSSQSYSTALGVGLTTEVQRQEDYDYLLSFSDLTSEFGDPSRAELYHGCQFADGLLLESDLGLTGLVDAALEPIASTVLYPSHNVGPGAAPPPTPANQLTPPGAQLKAIKAKITAARKPAIVGPPPPPIEEVEAAEIEKRTQAIINNVVKPLYGIASGSSFDPKCLADVTRNQNKAIVESVGVSELVIRVDQSTTDEARQAALALQREDFTRVVTFTNAMIKSYRSCANEKWKPAPVIYDPIDAIGETVNFFVTASGSATPIWKLINLTAPLSSTLASASRKDTDTLILSMGRPVPNPAGGISASDAMNSQVLASLLMQSFSQRPSP